MGRWPTESEVGGQGSIFDLDAFSVSDLSEPPSPKPKRVERGVRATPPVVGDCGTVRAEVQEKNRPPAQTVDPEFHDLRQEYARDEEHATFPWSRERPAPQWAQRGDGKPTRSGAGLASPTVWDPRKAPELSEIYLAPLGKEILDFLTKARLDEAMGSTGPEAGVREFQKRFETAGWHVAQTMAKFVAGEAFHEREAFLMEIPPGQPYRLHLIQALAETLGDEDAKLPTTVEGGVVLGDKEPLPDSGLWPLKEERKAEAADPSAEYIVWGSNYSSMEELEELVIPKIQTDVDRGWASPPFEWDQLCQELGMPEWADVDPLKDRERVAPPAVGVRKGESKRVDAKLEQVPAEFASGRLGAVLENAATGKCRVVFDGTAGGVNPRTALRETLQTPGLEDMQAALAYFLLFWEVFLDAIKVDVSAAFKGILLAASEWRRTIFFFRGHWHFYKVLPFGMKASAYWWVRFYALIHRVIQGILAFVPHAGFMYVDDAVWAFLRNMKTLMHRKLQALVLLVLIALGVPIAWEKLEWGENIEWVGFAVSFVQMTAQLTQKKLNALLRNAEDLNARAIRLQVVESLAGRMSWASGIYPPIRVLMRPFWRAIYSPRARKTGMINGGSALFEDFGKWLALLRKVTKGPVQLVRDHVPLCRCRVDAMGEGEIARIGGWFWQKSEADPCPKVGNVEWFQEEIPMAWFPDVKESASLIISALEYACSFAIAQIWGSRFPAKVLDAESDSMVTVLAKASGKAKSQNLAFVALRALAEEVRVDSMVRLTHVPGENNVVADAISRNFSNVMSNLDQSKRKRIDFSVFTLLDSEVLSRVQDPGDPGPEDHG